MTCFVVGLWSCEKQKWASGQISCYLREASALQTFKMPRVPATAMDVTALVQSAAAHARLELQLDETIRVQLPESPPLPRCNSRPFSKAFRKQFPTAKILSYDGDDDGKLPFVRSLVGAFRKSLVLTTLRK
eukprot:symbB.v1.2.004046.t1/scaffold228.1/size260974/15